MRTLVLISLLSGSCFAGIVKEVTFKAPYPRNAIWVRGDVHPVTIPPTPDSTATLDVSAGTLTYAPFTIDIPANQFTGSWERVNTMVIPAVCNLLECIDGETIVESIDTFTYEVTIPAYQMAFPGHTGRVRDIMPDRATLLPTLGSSTTVDVGWRVGEESGTAPLDIKGVLTTPFIGLTRAPNGEVIDFDFVPDRWGRFGVPDFSVRFQPPWPHLLDTEIDGERFRMVAVPEPSGLVLLLIGCFALWAVSAPAPIEPFDDSFLEQTVEISVSIVEAWRSTIGTN